MWYPFSHLCHGVCPLPVRLLVPKPQRFHSHVQGVSSECLGVFKLSRIMPHKTWLVHIQTPLHRPDWAEASGPDATKANSLSTLLLCVRFVSTTVPFTLIKHDGDLPLARYLRVDRAASQRLALLGPGKYSPSRTPLAPVLLASDSRQQCQSRDNGTSLARCRPRQGDDATMGWHGGSR